MSLRVKIALSLALTAVAVAAAIGVLVHLRTAETQLDTARRGLDTEFRSLLARQAEGQDAGLNVGAPLPAPLARTITSRPVRATFLDGDTLWAATVLNGRPVSLTRSYHPEQTQLAALDRTLLTSGVLAAVVASLAGMAVATGLSRRLRHVSQTATHIASGTLTARVFPPPSRSAAPPPTPTPPVAAHPQSAPAPPPDFAAPTSTPPPAESTATPPRPAPTSPAPPPARSPASTPPLADSTASPPLPAPTSAASTPPRPSSPASTPLSGPTATPPRPVQSPALPVATSLVSASSGGFVSGREAGRVGWGWRGDEVVAVGRAVDRMADALQARLEAERRVTADIAHELRTPVTGLITAADLLPPGRPTELVRDRAAVLGRLVEDILEVARLDAHTEQPVLEQRLLSVLTRRALAAASTYANPATTASDVVELVVVRDVEVETDPRRVERILANLVANAVRHGHPPVTVTVEGAQVRVEDHGPGFPAEMLEVLREHGPQRFASGASARGTGVGWG
ncbi:ATP-binding protein [Nonomuraea sp. NPDC050790]|uniref:ATP-binding protein n=1 Tax=Nonomuraea sp. NPDC050790 TaxID=3364371 RepID=UPI0037951CCC